MGLTTEDCQDQVPELTQSNLTSDQIINVNYSKVDSQPLCVDVSIVDSPFSIYNCLVDNGACINLIKDSVVDHLVGITKHPSVVQLISGVGNTQIPISYYVSLELRFCSGFVTESDEFYIVPSEIIDHPLVLGVTLLKNNNLLPDMSSYQLLHQEGNAFNVVATDPTKNVPPMNVCTDGNLELGANQCKVVPINLCNLSYSFKTFFYDGREDNGLEVLPGILSGTKPVIALCNYSDSCRFIPGGYSLGSVLPISEVEPVVIGNINTNSSSSVVPSEYWTRERVIQEFQIEDVPLDQVQKSLLIDLLQKYADVLSTGDDDVGCANNVKHHIELTTDKPIHVPVRRFQGPLSQEIEKQCVELEEAGIIRKSYSPYSAPVVPVRKPDGSLRVCLDYRCLNKYTKNDAFPLPNLIDSIYNMAGSKYFTTIDLVRGYYQIEMAEDSIEKTAFSTPLSHYEFLRMPFGVKGGPATFQRGMMLALSGIPWSQVMAYLDDIIIRSATFEEHLGALERVLHALQKNGFKLKPKKTKLCRESVEFLGHHISNQGILPLEKNISGALNFPIPTTVKQLRQFLGMVNFTVVTFPSVRLLQNHSLVRPEVKWFIDIGVPDGL